MGCIRRYLSITMHKNFWSYLSLSFHTEISVCDSFTSPPVQLGVHVLVYIFDMPHVVGTVGHAPTNRTGEMIWPRTVAHVSLDARCNKILTCFTPPTQFLVSFEVACHWLLAPLVEWQTNLTWCDDDVLRKINKKQN